MYCAVFPATAPAVGVQVLLFSCPNPPPPTFLPTKIHNYSIFENDPTLADIYEPKPRIATHARYRGWKSKYMMQIGQSRQHMNVLMQQGICLSPPLINSSTEYHITHRHRDDPICENITFFHKPGMNGIHTVQELGYYEEMHIFEFLDWSLVVPESKLKEQYNKRIERIGHCDMKFNPDEYKNIMRRPADMVNGGFRGRDRGRSRGRRLHHTQRSAGTETNTVGEV